MKKIIVLLAVVFSQHLCLSQNFFHTEDEYFSEVVKKTKLDTSKFVIDKLFTTEEFYSDVIDNQLYSFYGIIYNDEVFGASQLSIKSCWGQFLELSEHVKKEDDKIKSISITDKKYLEALKLNKSKKTVVFLYSVAFPKRDYKSFYSPIIEAIQKDPDFDYIVISLDYNRIKTH